jgi:hypothetical protein
VVVLILIQPAFILFVGRIHFMDMSKLAMMRIDGRLHGIEIENRAGFA